MPRDAYRDDQAPLSARAEELRARIAELSELQQARAAAEAELAALEARLEALSKKRSLPMLDRVSVAEPCSADWNKMVPVPTEADGPSGPGARVRFCGLCAKNVFNLSEMTREEATNFVASIEGTACVRFYKREDGTMLTADCPVGVRRRRRRRILGAVVAAASAVSASMYAFAANQTHCTMNRGGSTQVDARDTREVGGIDRRHEMMMGGIRPIDTHPNEHPLAPPKRR